MKLTNYTFLKSDSYKHLFEYIRPEDERGFDTLPRKTNGCTRHTNKSIPLSVDTSNGATES